MICVTKNNIEDKEFEALLEATRVSILKNGLNKKIDPLIFETLVFQKMSEEAAGTIFEEEIRLTGAHAFPDIIARNYFGVEVKTTTGDHWVSTGNSVLESSRIEGVEKIYIFFGKLGGKKDIKYKLYEDCLSDVAVTHSPRYRINMNLDKGHSIFDKMKISYDSLRKDKSPIRLVKNYYRGLLREGEELWWVDPEREDKGVSPIIRSYRNLDKKEKENFIAESMILFPEMFGNSTAKFERAASYLISEHNAVSANLRDLFSAGGQVKINLAGKMILVPQIFDNLQKNVPKIKKIINELPADKLAYYWRIEKISNNRLNQWKKLINERLDPKFDKLISAIVS